MYDASCHKSIQLPNDVVSVQQRSACASCYNLTYSPFVRYRDTLSPVERTKVLFGYPLFELINDRTKTAQVFGMREHSVFVIAGTAKVELRIERLDFVEGLRATAF